MPENPKVTRNITIAAVLLLLAFVLLLVVVFRSALASRWEITAENLGDEPCSVLVTMGGEGERTAKVDGLTGGKEIVMISERQDIFVHNVKVTVGMNERVLPYKGVLRIGSRLKIVVFADGRVSTSVDEDAMISLPRQQPAVAWAAAVPYP